MNSTSRKLISKMGSRWNKVWSLVSNKPSSTSFDIIMMFYTHESRKYHGIYHLDQCYRQYDMYMRDTDSDISVPLELGIPGHDVIYRPLSRNNEVESTILMENILYVGNVPQPIIKQVDLIIMATSFYSLSPEDQPELTDEGKLMHDIDLSILAEPWDYFVEYHTQIMAEFSPFVPQDELIKGRKDFLVMMSEKSPIFKTEYFHNKCEAVAKENIKNLLIQM